MKLWTCLRLATTALVIIGFLAGSFARPSMAAEVHVHCMSDMAMADMSMADMPSGAASVSIPEDTSSKSTPDCCGKSCPLQAMCASAFWFAEPARDAAAPTRTPTKVAALNLEVILKDGRSLPPSPPPPRS
jgi:hypothetical protein